MSKKVTPAPAKNFREPSGPPFRGVILFSLLPQLLLLALLLYLFVVLFRSCVTNKRGQEASSRLVRYLGELQEKFASRVPVDPIAERTALEPLLNKVKIENAPACISGDALLRFHFVRGYNLVTEWLLIRAAPADKVQWRLFDALMHDFYEDYLARQVPVPKQQRGPVFSGSLLPRRAI